MRGPDGVLCMDTQNYVPSSSNEDADECGTFSTFSFSARLIMFCHVTLSENNVAFRYVTILYTKVYPAGYQFCHTTIAAGYNFVIPKDDIYPARRLSARYCISV
jgi:hypothetical protein